MRIRNRLVALLMGVTSLGVVVAMLPSGASAGSAQEQTATSSGTNKTCNAAKKLADAELRVVRPHLNRAQLASYKAALDRAVKAACNSTLTCELLEGVIAELRTIRGGLLPAQLEATLQRLENELLKLVCSS